jgi:hypothetical protein
MRVAPAVKEVGNRNTVLSRTACFYTAPNQRSAATRSKKNQQTHWPDEYSPHRDSSRQFHALQEPLKSGVALQGISPGFDLKEGDAVGPHFISLVQVGKSLIFLPRGGMDNPGPPATPERSHLTKRVTSLLHTLS